MVAGVRADLGIKLFGDDLEVLKAKAAEIERVVKAIPGAADVTHRAGHRAAGAPGRGRPRRPWPATASRPRQVLDVVEAVGRHRGRRGPRARPAVPAGRPAARCPTATTRRPWRRSSSRPRRGSGSRSPGSRRLERDDRPLDDPARVGRAADRRPGQRPGPRHRLLRRRGPGADRPRGGAPGRLHRSSGAASSRTCERAETRLLHRRAARPGADPEPALPDVPLVPRRPDDLQRRALRPGRRRLRPLAPGHAVHDLGGRRLRRPGRGVDARRADPRQLHPRPHGPRRPEARGDRAGAARPAPARADDRRWWPPSASSR